MTQAKSVGVRWLRRALALGLVVVAALACAWSLRARPPEAPAGPKPRSRPNGVAALGYLAPKGDVLGLAPATGLDGVRVDRLLVAEGDRVEAAALLALLDTHARRTAAVKESEAKVESAAAKLRQVEAGAKPGDVAAQQAVVARCVAEQANAEQDLRRMESLPAHAVSSEELAQRRLKVEQVREALRQARAQLDAVKMVRDVDVLVARTEVASAQASLEVARADLEAATVRAPCAGQVLKIHAHAGERVGDKGVLDFGQVQEMHAVAEVYEEDIPRVRFGQAARVRVPSLGADLAGEVAQVGLTVSRKNVLNNDPVADTDARVVEVRVRLKPADGAKVAGLSNARVEVVIDAR